jgi:hypothetical protein
VLGSARNITCIEDGFVLLLQSTNFTWLLLSHPYREELRVHHRHCPHHVVCLPLLSGVSGVIGGVVLFAVEIFNCHWINGVVILIFA